MNNKSKNSPKIINKNHKIFLSRLFINGPKNAKKQKNKQQIKSNLTSNLIYYINRHIECL
jgi:hypothetical protein